MFALTLILFRTSTLSVQKLATLECVPFERSSRENSTYLQRREIGQSLPRKRRMLTLLPFSLLRRNTNLYLTILNLSVCLQSSLKAAIHLRNRSLRMNKLSGLTMCSLVRRNLKKHPSMGLTTLLCPMHKLRNLRLCRLLLYRALSRQYASLLTSRALPRLRKFPLLRYRLAHLRRLHIMYLPKTYLLNKTPRITL